MKTQTFYNVFISNKGMPFAPVAVEFDVIEYDGCPIIDDSDLKMFHPAFKYCAQFETIIEATDFYRDVLTYAKKLKIFRGVCGTYNNDQKDDFIDQELNRIKSLTPKPLKNYSGFFLQPCHDTGLSMGWKFKKSDQGDQGMDIRDVLNIII